MKNYPDEVAPQNWRTGSPGQQDFAPAVQLDYASLLNRMKRNWYWFVLAIAACVGAAWLHLRYTTPVYLAQTSMLIQEQSGGQAGLSKEVISQQLGFENTYVIDNEIYMLRSKYLMERVVNLLGLDISYIHQGAVRNTEIYQPENFGLVLLDTTKATPDTPVEYGSVMVRFDNPSTFSLIRYGGDTTSVSYGEPFEIGNRQFAMTISSDDPPEDNTSIYQVNVMNPTRVALQYNNSLSVQQVERSGVVTLYLSDPIPDKARDILDALVTVYEQQIVEQQSQTGGQTLSFLEERLDYVTDELYEVESNVASFKRSANLSVDIQTQGANYLAQMNEADAQLAELQVRRDLIIDIRNTLTEGDENFEMLPVSSEIISGVLAQLITEYNDQIFRRDQRLETVTPDHPMVATFDEKLGDLKRSILRSVNSLLRETNERVSKIEERIRPLQAQMTRIPGNEQRLLQIMRQQEIKQNLFMFLLEKREEAALSIAAQVPNTRIIDRASSTSAPISPNEPAFYLLAIGMGLFIPGSLIFLRELLGTTIGTEREIMKYMPYPVVGRIIKSPDHGTVIVTKTNRNGAAEAFRLLRTNLGFLLPSEQSSVILVTSSVSGEGKSFIATNLSAALALSKKRVVVVGLDMRKPRLAEMVTDEAVDHKAVGLSNYLIGKSSYEDIIRPTSQEGLHLITSGPLPPNPAELLMEGRMTNLVHRLRQEFDVVILDAPPVGIVTDGLLMKDLVNLTLFVARINVTPKKSAGYINEMVEAGKLPRVNLVINGIDPKSSYGYGYGYYE
ncbi:GumC family protein [Neolewinella litorea]|uniref:non-specific protein-tyrosine kinase n=1 Tax=Neolewinella litorea TaxID=2562452 RepID=A0A4S4NLT2_9BACT|nr:polysaccharide biosynthesis tyrosine autokinase [Neolewinella litorea]THH39288.1 polysaccharide biosynthesis tyrosine autokinase [Neolewinella litorea]